MRNEGELMKQPLKWILAAALLTLSGCQDKGHSTVESRVNGITDDVPEIDIPQTDIDFSQFDTLDASMQAWGLGKEKDANGQPLDAVSANEKYKPYDTVFVGRADQKVYLTFDNGYENGNTPAILDTLREKNVSAVFFVTAQYVRENPELIQRMIDEGHIIGNHSYHHHSFPAITIEQVRDEIMQLDALMLQQFQYKMTLVRPPKGEFSERTLALSNLLGYQTVLWSFAYYDYNVNDQPADDAALKKTLENAHPGAIYLLHSVSDTNTRILGDLIDGLRQRNYEVARYDLD